MAIGQDEEPSPEISRQSSKNEFLGERLLRPFIDFKPKKSVADLKLLETSSDYELYRDSKQKEEALQDPCEDNLDIL